MWFIFLFSFFSLFIICIPIYPLILIFSLFFFPTFSTPIVDDKHFIIPVSRNTTSKAAPPWALTVAPRIMGCSLSCNGEVKIVLFYLCNANPFLPSNQYSLTPNLQQFAHSLPRPNPQHLVLATRVQSWHLHLYALHRPLSSLFLPPPYLLPYPITIDGDHGNGAPCTTTPINLNIEKDTRLQNITNL